MYPSAVFLGSNCSLSVLYSFHYSCFPNFFQFKEVFVYLEKESRKRDLEFRISYESLLLYPDYQHRVNVLKTLKYIDDEEMVQMKGKVACGMGSNELIITELIFQNSLSKFEPAEIAALLSCLVFQVKMQDDFTNELSERLKEV